MAPRAALPATSSPANPGATATHTGKGPALPQATTSGLTQLPRAVLENVARRLDPDDCFSLARTSTEACRQLRDTPVLKSLRLDGLVANARTLDQLRELLTADGAAGPKETISSLPEPFRSKQVSAVLGRIHLLPESQMQEAFDVGHEAIRKLPESRRGLALQSLIGELPSLPIGLRRAEYMRCREVVRRLSDEQSAMNALIRQAWSIPADMDSHSSSALPAERFVRGPTG